MTDFRKPTKKDTYLPFLREMRRKDKQFKTNVIPKGLNENSSKQKLKEFYDTMQSNISLERLAQSTENKFLKQLEQQRRDELEVVRNTPNVERFRNILNGMLGRGFVKIQYHLMVTIEWEYEYKNKDGTRSGKIYYETERHLNVIEASDKSELHDRFKHEYNPTLLHGEDSEKWWYCLGTSYDISNEQRLIENARPQREQLMRAGSIILAKEWLKFGKNVSEKAFEETDDTCCYHQLSHFINNPPTNRPQKSFESDGVKYKTDKQGLFRFFKEFADKKCPDEEGLTYPDFQIQSGVSCEMILKLCEKLGRSCYCYNGDKYVIKNKNYCPIAFYKYNGHMFIIDDKDCFKNIAESNKDASLVDKQIGENIDATLKVEYINNFEVANAKNMESKLYIVGKYSLIDDVIKYVANNKSIPKIKSKEGKIVYICF